MWVQTNDLKILNVQEMVRAIDMLERQIRSVAPTVRFAGQKGNPLAVLRCRGKGRKILRQTRQRQLIHDPMPLIIPAPAIQLAEAQNDRDGPKGTKTYSHKQEGPG